MPGDEFRNGGPGQDARVARGQDGGWVQKSRDFRRADSQTKHSNLQIVGYANDVS